MIITVSRPPHQKDINLVEHTYTLPQLLALYIDSRNWSREQEAVQWRQLAMEMQMQAVLRGANEREAEEFARPVMNQAVALVRPEAPMEAPTLTDLQKKLFGIRD